MRSFAAWIVALSLAGCGTPATDEPVSAPVEGIRFLGDSGEGG